MISITRMLYAVDAAGVLRSLIAMVAHVAPRSYRDQRRHSESKCTGLEQRLDEHSSGISNSAAGVKGRYWMNNTDFAILILVI